ncbi:MAG: PRD domain-containing protein [Hungatella sp.]|nr:PRD domain-containing protein [Hungatella sp.]
MKIVKFLNNNAALVLDGQERELVVMGKGIAHSAHKNEEISRELIDKIFILDDRSQLAQYTQLFSEIPDGIFELAGRFVTKAKKDLNRTLQNSLVISLADHLNSMVERGKLGAYLENRMLWDIRKMYQDEFRLSREMVAEFNKLYDTLYDDHEAATLAMHFVNAELESGMENAGKITKLIGEILNIVKYHFLIDYDEESYVYYRFVTHLRFLAQRIFQGSQVKDADMSEMLKGQLSERYEDTFQCVKKIRDFFWNHYHYCFTEQEGLYLAIHIIKILDDNIKTN